MKFFFPPPPRPAAREAILFRGVPDLLRCLEALVADSDVEVLRIKNRLSPAYDGDATAGYRCGRESERGREREREE